MKNGWTRSLHAAALIATLLFCTVVIAEPYYVHPRAMAMGSAYTSVANDTGAMEFNPAGLGQKKYLWIEAAYQRIEMMDPTDEDDKLIDDRLHSAVVDSKTSPHFVAGLSFTTDGNPAKAISDNQNYQGLLALAFPSPGNMFGFGASVKFVRFDDEAPQDEAISADVGFILTATPWFHFGIAGRNLVPQEEKRVLDSELAVGVSTQVLGFFTLAFDATWGWEYEPEDQFNFHIGAEGLIAGMVALRAGYFFDEYVDKDYYSVGLAYENDMGALSYTFRNNPEEVREFIHAFQVMIRF